MKTTPDGSEILVVSEQAYFVSSDGSEQRALAHANPIRHAVWSPDGSRIALYDSRSLSEKQCSKRYASLVECKDANYSTTKSRLL